MPEFRFKAIDANGRVVNGVSTAQDNQNLSSILQEQGLFLMECQESITAADLGVAEAPAKTGWNRSIKLPQRRRKISVKDISFLTAQLAIMVRSALPLLEALDLLLAQTDNPSIKEVLTDVKQSVNEGLSLSASFARHPQVFDEVYVSLIAAGEASGDLDVMLDRLTSHLAFHLKLKQSIRSVLAYPAIVVTTACAVIGFLVVFVLPTFMEVFTQLNIELPLPTRILIMISEAVRMWWYWFIAAAIGAALLFKQWLKDPRNMRIANHVQLRLPIIGPLTKNIVLTRTLRTMGSLIDSGVSIMKSLELSKAAAGNQVFYDLMEKVAVDVRDGKGLSWSFSQSPYIPRVVIGMLATGERTGTLPEVIKRVADFYEAETESSIKDLFSALEPIFIVGLGLMVGGIAVSVLLPMFDVAQGIQ